MGTKNNPGEFDCYAAAAPDEPMFILLARDAKAPRAVLGWAMERYDDVLAGHKPQADLAKVLEAMDCARQMIEWRLSNRPLHVPPARD